MKPASTPTAIRHTKERNEVPRLHPDPHRNRRAARDTLAGLFLARVVHLTIPLPGVWLCRRTAGDLAARESGWAKSATA